MKIIAYLAFTLLSIVIQFCLMDFIQEKLQGNNGSVNGNITYERRRTTDMNNEPYELFLRTDELIENMTYTNVSIRSPLGDEFVTTTEMDILYDNVSITENYFTTESIYFTNEFENITELNLFNKKNHTIQKPVNTPKPSSSRDKCSCNLLYKVCDVNCCCDSDCSNIQIESFPNCVQNSDINNMKTNENVCYSLFQRAEGRHTLPGDLFCVAKTNIPDKRDINIKKYDTLDINTIKTESFMWHATVKQNLRHQFTKKLYAYGDQVWMLSNNTVNYIDLPSPTVNNYCSGRESMKFLKDEHIKCIVKIKDLEMFHVLKNSEDSLVLSVTEKSFNNTIMNCTTAHCTNWTIFTCDGVYCTVYNRSLHEPMCTDNICTNIAHRVDYLFYCYDKKIVNVTVKLYPLNISTFIPFITQTVAVKFYLTNKTDIIELSGNPGYIQGLPVIVSHAKGNYTANFFNTCSNFDRYLLKPDRRDGVCKLLNSAENYVNFNLNERVKCQYVYENSLLNYTNICEELTKDLRNILRLDFGTVVSPYGNPKDVLDEEWKFMRIDDSSLDKLTYGTIDEKQSTFNCFNLITRTSIVFTYADVSEDSTKIENKILSAETFVTKENKSFNMDDISATVTFEVTFVDITKPPIYEFAGSPHINIRLPKDFFFPFDSNESADIRYNRNSSLLLAVSCVLLVILSANKITDL